MISKEAFRLIVTTTGARTGLSQEEMAIDMGYGKNYISDMLTPTGKVSEKFINAFNRHFNSENTKTEPPKELPWQIIDRLSKGIENITEANLILARKISSGEYVSDPLFGEAGRKDKWDDTEELPLSGKIKSGPSKKRKGILKTVNK